MASRLFAPASSERVSGSLRGSGPESGVREHGAAAHPAVASAGAGQEYVGRGRERFKLGIFIPNPKTGFSG